VTRGSYVMGMLRIISASLAITLFTAMPAGAGVLDDNYLIMKPEPNFPGVVNRYKSPRGTKQHVVIPKPTPDEPRRVPVTPPPVINSRTGQAVPNLPAVVPGSGPGGRETFQDRSMRCTHQAGVYGQAPGSNYIASCVNQ
jgi:hypothetical protein